MAAPPEHWIAHHFSIANPKGRRQSDLPRLLRSVATEVEALGDATQEPGQVALTPALGVGEHEAAHTPVVR